MTSDTIPFSIRQMAASRSSNHARIVANYVRLMLSFLLGLVLVRLLLEMGEAAFALIALLGAGTGIAAAVKEVVRASMIPELSAAYHGGRQRFRETYNTALLLAPIVGVISLAGFAVLAVLIPWLQIHNELVVAARLFVAAKAIQTCIVICLAPTFSMYMVSERMVSYNAWVVVERLCEVIAAVTVLMLLSGEAVGRQIAAFGILSSGLGVATLAASTVLLIRSDNELVPRFGAGTMSAAKSLVRSASGNAIVVVAMNMYTRLDMLIMNLMFGLFGNLVFGLASQLTAYVRQLAMGIVAGVEAIAARLTSNHRGSEVKRLMSHSLRLQAIVVIPASVLLFLWADNLIAIWVDSRIEDPSTTIPTVATLVRILVVGIAARSLSESWMRVLAGAGQVGLYAPVFLAAALSNPLLAIAAIYVVTPSFQIFAVALVFSFLLTVVHMIYLPLVVAKHYQLRFRDVLEPLIRPALATTVSLLAGQVARRFSGVDSSAWVAPLVAFLVTYGLSCILFVIGPREQVFLMNLFGFRLRSNKSVSSGINHKAANVTLEDSMAWNEQRGEEGEAPTWPTRDLLLGPLRLANSLLPETRLKNMCRARLLAFRNALPRELMVRSGDTAVQVGMWRERNFRRLIDCVGPRGRVVLVEADKNVVDRLQRFVARNKISNVTIVNKGAWSGPGEITLRVGQSSAHNRLDATEVQMLGEMNVDVFSEERVIPVDSIDNILADLGIERVEYVEISVNGAERDVLVGMKRTLANTKKLFVAGYARLDNGTTPTNRIVESQLRTLGFRTIVSHQTKPVQANFDQDAAKRWGNQDGHVFAWSDAA